MTAMPNPPRITPDYHWLIRAMAAWPQLQLVIEEAEDFVDVARWGSNHGIDRCRSKLRAEIEKLMAECGREPIE